MRNIYHKMYSCSNIINQYDLNTDIIIFALFSFIFGMKRTYETCMKSG